MVVGILSVIVVAVIRQVRASSERVKCATHMRQYLLAVPMYQADNSGKLPECYHGAVAGEVAGQLGIYLAPPKGLEGIELVRWAKKNVTCPVTGWGFAFNSWTSAISGNDLADPSRLIYAMDHTSASSAIRPITFTGLPGDFRQKTPRPHGAKVNVGYLDSHVETRLASSLVWADFTRGTPSYLSSHDTRAVTTAQYDQ